MGLAGIAYKTNNKPKKEKNYIEDNRLAGLRTKQCAVCGKEFDVTPEYKFKRKLKGKNSSRMCYYCSYSCYNKKD